MIRIADIAGAIDMSRVERNAHLYEEIEKEVEQLSKGKGKRTAGFVLGALGNLLMLAIVVACIGLAMPRIAGYDGFVVVSGSMEPAIPVGSLVFSKEVDPADVQVGDVIVFRTAARGDTPITHRVVRNDRAARQITTKGDANEREDVSPVTYDNVVGKVRMHIPRVGFIASMLTSVLGKIVAVLLLVEAWLLTEVGKRLRAKA